MLNFTQKLLDMINDGKIEKVITLESEFSKNYDSLFGELNSYLNDL